MSQELVLYEKTPREKSNENLIRFSEGFDPRRRKGTGRPGRLDDPSFLDLFSQACARGLETKELGQLFDLPIRTAREYKKDARVVALVRKYMEERVRDVVRKTDSQIQMRLRRAEEMTVKELLEIRKEFLGGLFRQETEGGKEDPELIKAAQNALEANPELAAEMGQMFEKLAETMPS